MLDSPARDVGRIRVLIPTSRHVHRLVSYGVVLDFEDAVAAASTADLVPVPMYSRRAQLDGLLHGRPLTASTPPRADYDVCFLVAMAPYWVDSLRYIRNLRRVAKKVVVYLFDAWLADLGALRAHRGVWAEVDELFVSLPHVVSAYSEHLGRPVHYLPQAIDARWFHPYRTERPLELLSIGRRVPSVHGHLLEIARRRDLFYFYSTHQRPSEISFREGRELLGRLLQSARVHVNWSVECTSPKRVDDREAVTARWFESAASGGVILGRAPATDEFRRLFPIDGFVHDLSPTASAQLVEDALDSALGDRRYDDRRALAEHVRAAHTWDVRWREIVELAGI